MKNKNGFISISIIYSFFLIFILLLILVLGRYLNNRSIYGTLKENIKETNYNNDFELIPPVGIEKVEKPTPPEEPIIPEVPKEPEIVLGEDDGYEFNKTYTTCGNYQKITIEKNGYYYVEAYGAQGGRGVKNGATSGKVGAGAMITGEIYLQEGEVLYAYIGCSGKNATKTTFGEGGYNGGASGGTNEKTNSNNNGGGGGGATDIRCFYNALTGKCEENTENLAWNDPISLNSRIMVAAGGGGGGTGSKGGNGGITIGEAGDKAVSTLPTQTVGNEFGIGKIGVSCSSGGGGGAGGGWYGGDSACNTGGSGGSSYISGFLGCNSIKNLIDNAKLRTPKCSETDVNSNDSCSVHPSSKKFINVTTSAGKNADSGKLKIMYLGANYGKNINFVKTYTTAQQTIITIEYSGLYKLEVWGGQGGTGSTTGGYGGYSVGYSYLKKNDKLYINVGGQGENAQRGSSKEVFAAGGYNGGGEGHIKGISKKEAKSGGGGGATHIATVAGELKNLSSSKSNILIVAGGGGGAGYYDSDEYGNGGNAGGYKGNNGGCKGGNSQGSGGTQTTFGKSLNLSYDYGEGDFGKGGNTGTGGNPGIYYGGAGGGGYYGGGGNSPGSKCGGGGGSGYIGNSKLFNYHQQKKYMNCNKCGTNTEVNTFTTSNESYSSTATADKSKSGVGAARITLIDNSSN